MNLNKSDIENILPHREPILLVDSAKIISKKEVHSNIFINPNWDIFKGHFPKKSILPGVYIAEIMAQTSSIPLLLKEENKNALPIFLSIAKMRFIRPVFPNQTMKIISTLENEGEGFVYDFNVKAFLEDKKIAAGKISLFLQFD